MSRGSVTGTGRASTLCAVGGIPHLPGSRPRGWSSVLGGGGTQCRFWHIRQKLHCGCYLCVPPPTLGFDLWRRGMSALSRPRMPGELAGGYPVQRQWLAGSPGGGARVRLTSVSPGGRLLAQRCRNWAHQARDKLLFYVSQKGCSTGRGGACQFAAVAIRCIGAIIRGEQIHKQPGNMSERCCCVQECCGTPCSMYGGLSGFTIRAQKR